MTDAGGRSESDLMELHAEALFTHDDRGRLRSVNEPDGGRAPRFFLGRTPDGNVCRFRADLPDDLVERLRELCAEEPIPTDLHTEPQRSTEYVSLLAEHAPVGERGGGPAYRFPERIRSPSREPIEVTAENAEALSPGFDEWVPDVARCQPFLAIVAADRPASLCCSVRITSQMHEAGVETLSAFRREEYATDVVAAWATAVRDIGCIPSYSTSWENTASQGVAAKLSLVQYGADFYVE